MGVAVAGKRPKNEVLSAAVPRKVKTEVDAVAHGAGFTRSEAAELLIRAGLVVFAALLASGELARALGDPKKVRRYGPRALKKSLELISTVKGAE